MENNHNLIYKQEVYQIIGAAMEVHRTLGCGYLEAVYQEAFFIELLDRNIPAISQYEILIQYKNHQLQKKYIADFVLFDRIITEIKALEKITSFEEAQLLNYLKATGFELGLLINFGAESLQWKRIILMKPITNGLTMNSSFHQ